MPTMDFHVGSDTTNMHCQIVNSGADTPTIITSRWLRTPEERRICQMVIGVGAKRFDIRFEFVDSLFLEHTVTGKDSFPDVPRY